MNISLDYDDTISRDPVAWEEFCKYFRSRGHAVFIVTWRSLEEGKEILREGWGKKVDGIYCTNRKAKEKFMYDQGIRIDIFIDDNPSSILFSQATSFPSFE